MSALAKNYNRRKIAFKRGKGSFLYSTNGKKYLDFVQGIAVNSLGHSNPYLIRAINKQAKKVWHVSNAFIIPEGEKLAKRLTQKTFADYVIFQNSGTEATEAAISNPLLENNSMKGAKGVLINVTCSDDTSLHDIDLAINRVQEESDDEANIIWGVQKDDNFEGKFKISVISTGIDCENYYKNLANKSNVKEISFAENNQSLENQKSFYP